MSLVVLSLILQALLIVHCIKTGRNQIWIWVLALLSYAGVIAYIAAELIPGLLRSRTTQRTVKGVRKALDPGADLRRLGHQARVTGGVDARQRYAEELLRQDRPREAVETYQQTLKGLYEHDPNLMLGLARAQFACGEAAAARATLDALMRQNPDFRSQEGHLLYARALEAEGDTARALEEYRTLAGYFSGAEATVRYARLLQASGRAAEAREPLRSLLDQAALAPAHYRRGQENWLREAERALAECPVQ
ncbi:MAG: tetratricopeptide repeat protein [Steroidobacteraceae bacterium]